MIDKYNYLVHDLTNLIHTQSNLPSISLFDKRVEHLTILANVQLLRNTTKLWLSTT